MPTDWYKAENIQEVDSPALLIYPDRVRENIRRMINLVGSADRLRPHIKTHKLPEVIRMQLECGIRKYKCATIAEAEILGECGAPDVLLAYQPVGPKVERLIGLVRKFPETKFAAIVDDSEAILSLSKAFQSERLSIELLLDIDCGMGRCGVPVGTLAKNLYRTIATSQALRVGGLHVYDGHINDRDPEVRRQNCDAAFAPVAEFSAELKRKGLAVPTIIAGGTPTFPIHAARPDVECSPGTTLFWDAGYSTKYPDLDFLPSALVLTRVISKPGSNRLCLDLGHKAIAAENPHPRVHLLGLPEAKAVGHSEEHLLIETAEADRFHVGDAFYGMPWHICPTVALYSNAYTIRDGKISDCWKVVARERTLSV